MALIEGLQSSPEFLLACCLLLGLAVGSFLNVVAHRMPLMMDAQWRAEAREILELEAEADATGISLSKPASSCPKCQSRIRPWQNIPVLSWLLLRGKCANCKAPISAQYPLVEACAGVMSAVCAWRFGFGFELVGALLLTWTLIPLTVIDLRTQLLPDNLTLPLLWAGLAFNLIGGFTSLESAVLGAILGYGSFWLIFQLFRLATGKEGMGFGDFKLLAALAAWLGAISLPLIILISSIAGAIVGLGLMVSGRLNRETPMPFGPYLAIAGWIMLIWGEPLRAIWLGALAPG